MTTIHPHDAEDLAAEAAGVLSASDSALFTADGAVGSFHGVELGVRAVCDNAVHALFMKHLLVRPMAVPYTLPIEADVSM